MRRASEQAADGLAIVATKDGTQVQLPPRALGPLGPSLALAGVGSVFALFALGWMWMPISWAWETQGMPLFMRVFFVLFASTGLLPLGMGLSMMAIAVVLRSGGSFTSIEVTARQLIAREHWRVFRLRSRRRRDALTGLHLIANPPRRSEDSADADEGGQQAVALAREGEPVLVARCVRGKPLRLCSGYPPAILRAVAMQLRTLIAPTPVLLELPEERTEPQLLLAERAEEVAARSQTVQASETLPPTIDVDRGVLGFAVQLRRQRSHGLGILCFGIFWLLFVGGLATAFVFFEGGIEQIPGSVAFIAGPVLGLFACVGFCIVAFGLWLFAATRRVEMHDGTLILREGHRRLRAGTEQIVDVEVVPSGTTIGDTTLLQLRVRYHDMTGRDATGRDATAWTCFQGRAESELRWLAYEIQRQLRQP